MIREAATALVGGLLFFAGFVAFCVLLFTMTPWPRPPARRSNPRRKPDDGYSMAGRIR